MAGLPKKYAKMGFRKGWKAYKASKRKSYKRPSGTTRSRRGTRTTKRSGFSTKTLFKWLRLGALAAPGAYWAMQPGLDATSKISYALRSYTGYNLLSNTFTASRLKEGWLPFILTSLLSVGIGKLNGIIRRL